MAPTHLRDREDRVEIKKNRQITHYKFRIKITTPYRTHSGAIKKKKKKTQSNKCPKSLIHVRQPQPSHSLQTRLTAVTEHRVFSWYAKMLPPRTSTISKGQDGVPLGSKECYSTFTIQRECQTITLTQEMFSAPTKTTSSMCPWASICFRG